MSLTACSVPELVQHKPTLGQFWCLVLVLPPITLPEPPGSGEVGGGWREEGEDILRCGEGSRDKVGEQDEKGQDQWSSASPDPEPLVDSASLQRCLRIV